MIVNAWDVGGSKVPVRLEQGYATAYRPRLNPPAAWSIARAIGGMVDEDPPPFDRGDCPLNWPFEPGTLGGRFEIVGHEVEILPVRASSPRYWPIEHKAQLFISAIYHVQSAEQAARLVWVAELRHFCQADHVHYDPDSGITRDVGVRSLVMLTDSEAEDWLKVNKYRMPTRSPVVGPFDRDDLSRLAEADHRDPCHTIDGVACVTPEQVAEGLSVGLRRVYRWLQRRDAPSPIGGIKDRGRTPRSYHWHVIRPFLEARVKRGLPEYPGDLRPPLTAR